MDNGNLYIGLLNKGEEGFEDFGDLTINLPGGYMLEEYEAFISGDFAEDKLNFITQNKLGEVQPWQGKSGMGTYAVVQFDSKRLEELDSDGLRDYQRVNGIEPEIQNDNHIKENQKRSR